MSLKEKLIILHQLKNDLDNNVITFSQYTYISEEVLKW